MKIGDTGVVTIAGGGLAGALLAAMLAAQGLRVEVFERHADPRLGDPPDGRSINLALAERGCHALRLAGLDDAVDEFVLPMTGRMMHDREGRLTPQPYGAAGERIWSSNRAQLNCVLLNGAEATGRVDLHFGRRIETVDWDARQLHFSDGESRSFEVLIGADGGGSVVRRAMASHTDIGAREELLEHGYRELSIPPAADGGFAMDARSLHIWPRGGFMLIALPNLDGSFTATLFLPKDGDPGFSALGDWPAQQAFMQREFPDAVPLMTDMQAEFRDNPVGLLGTIRCRQWHLGGTAALLGDAAHAIVPFHGQGMNAAFEDCEVMGRLVRDRDRDWSEVFAQYQALRRDNANAIADMALENYRVMRESVADPRFLLRKALEHELERRFGDRFIARYSLVMFHRLPYAEVFRRGNTQAAILETLLDGADGLDDISFDQARRLVEAELAPIRS
ncbi:FAD-dependent monooxygenase [Marinihelvus fidelis]|uniref:FAD-dependent monooxygenase n=1 Tax=Marinihelvus fidelis TaxID=2613842 RepID=A0A5N0T704_9GAMM|nr:NAD(P)/FAD-dependent oxidoreductase [Marinihelvus fidelis]KAA9130571.1 FAD-dependent monooxygenase [Marinihelvus fidelis]